MSREIDVQVAQVLGLDVVGEAWAWEAWDGPGWFVEDREWEGRSLQPVWVAHCVCEFYPSDDPEWDDDPVLGHYPGCFDVVADYSTDIAVACQQVEGWIESRPERIKYAIALRDLVMKDIAHRCNVDINWSDYMNEMYWRLAHATPGQRCLAFLAAMGK